MAYKYASLPFLELEARLRRTGVVWLRNDDLLLLEELLRRAKPFAYTNTDELALLIGQLEALHDRMKRDAVIALQEDSHD